MIPFKIHDVTNPYVTSAILEVFYFSLAEANSFTVKDETPLLRNFSISEIS
jgi:hypothetical protein